MKVVVQIPCYNEAKTLPLVFQNMPRKIHGVDVLEYQVIDDGSTDNTAAVAKQLGVHHIVRVPGRNRRWLGRAFKLGIDHALANGADIVVNTDGDNQYPSSSIPELIRPLLQGTAQIAIGDRNPGSIQEYSLVKRSLQRLGSAIIQVITGHDVKDAVSGFRAYTRESLLRIQILTDYTYTVDTLIQAHKKGLDIAWVPVNVNKKTRESRLIPNLSFKLFKSGSTILRLAVVYEPFKTFALCALVCMIPAAFIFLRFLLFYLMGQGDGHIQSLVVGGAFFVVSALLFVLGIVSDLLAVNRKLVEELLSRVRKLELEPRAEDTFEEIVERWRRVNE